MKKGILSIIVLMLMANIITIGVRFKLSKEDLVTIKTYINGMLASSYPASTDGYKISNISCTNNAAATFNYSTWRLEVSNVTSNTTCTVEFTSNDNQTFANYLISKACSSTPTTDDAAKNCLVNENGYRFEGKNPNNYVLFNDELWRVIGVFNVKTSTGVTQNLVKLIRNSALYGLSWRKSNSGFMNWNNSLLQQQLNSCYLNANNNNCDPSYNDGANTCDFSEVGLSDISREMIESVVWNLGGMSTFSATAASFYDGERGTNTYNDNPTTWTGKIGLFYPSDYGYAALSRRCSRNTNLNSYNTSSCAGNNWLKSNAAEWTITADYSSGTTGFFIYHDGALNNTFFGPNYGFRPSIYLKSNITIMGGDGSYNNPYLISAS